MVLNQSACVFALVIFNYLLDRTLILISLLQYCHYSLSVNYIQCSFNLVFLTGFSFNSPLPIYSSVLKLRHCESGVSYYRTYIVTKCVPSQALHPPEPSTQSIRRLHMHLYNINLQIYFVSEWLWPGIPVLLSSNTVCIAKLYPPSFWTWTNVHSERRHKQCELLYWPQLFKRWITLSTG